MDKNAEYFSATRGTVKIVDMHDLHLASAIKRVEGIARLLEMPPEEYPCYNDLIEHQKFRFSNVNTKDIGKM